MAEAPDGPASAFAEAYLETMRVERNVSPNTLRAYRNDILDFL